VQYGILHYDNLGQRPQGTLGHWMTYSGLLMIVIGVAVARLVFGTSDRTWAALVLPALGVAVALTFTRNSGSSPAPAAAPPPQEEPAPAPAPSQPAPPSAAANSYAGGDVSVPAGQSILVRMIDGVDSSKNHVGDLFHASLETDLNVNGVLVARKGTDVYGRLASSDKGGTFSGKSELQLELTRLVIDGKDYPVVSSDYNVQGKSQGSSTAKKVGGGAVAGAIIGAIAGGGKGAAIGAAAGGGAGAGVQILTKGDRVKVPSETLLEFRLQQPVMITPTSR